MQKLPLLANIFIIAVSAAAGAAEGMHLFRNNIRLESRRNFRNYGSLLSAVALLCVVLIIEFLLNRNAALSWKLPFAVQYFSTPFFWGFSLFVLVFVMSINVSVAFMERHNKRHKVLAIAILLIAGLEIYIVRMSRPVADKLTEEYADGVVLQSSGVTCVPAVCSNILNINGINKTEKEMAILLGTTLSGTNMASAIYVMRDLGFDAARKESPRLHPESFSSPAMFFVDHPATGPESHAVMYHGKVGERIEIWDPLQGKVIMSREDLALIWHGRGLEFRKK